MRFLRNTSLYGNKRGEIYGICIGHLYIMWIDPWDDGYNLKIEIH